MTTLHHALFRAAGLVALAASIGCANGAHMAEADAAAGVAGSTEGLAPSSFDGKVDQITYVKPGYRTFLEEGRLWVFRADSPELAEKLSGGELAKHVTLVAAGPGGLTLKAPDRETALGYMARKTGFVTKLEDGRVWIFAESSEELAAFERDGELAKHVTRVGVGPLGATVKGPDNETIRAYLIAQPGFETIVDEDDRLWIFRTGSEEAAEAKAGGLPEKHFTVVGAGPLGMTVRALDRESASAYLALCGAR